MKKRNCLLSLVLACVMCFGVVGMVWASDVRPEVTVNGQQADTHMIVYNGHWYMKLRDVCNIYYVDLEYDNLAKTISVYDRPQPTLWQIRQGRVWSQDESEIAAVIHNGAVYVALNLLPINGDLHSAVANGKVDLQRQFYFRDNEWYYCLLDELYLISGMPHYQNVNDVSYVVCKSLGAESTLTSTKVWRFSDNGEARVVAEFTPQIVDFVIMDDGVYIIGKDSWNACTIWKYSVTDGSCIQLGQKDYAYGDNLCNAQENGYLAEDIALLPADGLLVRDDGIYTVGYSQEGYFENTLIDENKFLESYGYYRLDKDGGSHQRVDNLPK